MTETKLKPTDEEIYVSDGIYAKYIKRPMDFFLSLCALIVLSPVLMVLIIVGAIEMKGNPFFTQLRPGKDEKIFKLIKFRTMTCECDERGNLLPDDKRLTKYGKLLRSTSLDELPELINILKGDMAVIGPRPLLPEYLPYYNDMESHRHDVRPGLTGLAQIGGRNFLMWEERFKIDVDYVQSITFKLDVKIVLDTILKVLKGSDVSVDTNSEEGNFAQIRAAQLQKISIGEEN